MNDTDDDEEEEDEDGARTYILKTSRRIVVCFGVPQTARRDLNGLMFSLSNGYLNDNLVSRKVQIYMCGGDTKAGIRKSRTNEEMVISRARFVLR